MQRNIGPKLGQYNTNDFLFCFDLNARASHVISFANAAAGTQEEGGEEGRGGESKKRCKPMLS